jgi:hypothetical protein
LGGARMRVGGRLVSSSEFSLRLTWLTVHFASNGGQTDIYKTFFLRYPSLPRYRTLALLKSSTLTSPAHNVPHRLLCSPGVSVPRKRTSWASPRDPCTQKPWCHLLLPSYSRPLPPPTYLASRCCSLCGTSRLTPPEASLPLSISNAGLESFHRPFPVISPLLFQ